MALGFISRPHTAEAPSARPGTAGHMAIIGAGPVGLALAILVARRCPHWMVSLFDARPLHADTGRDPRTLALSLGSVQLLRQLGAFPAQGTQPIREVLVSQEAPAVALAGSRPQVTIRADEMGVAELGAVMAYGTLVPALQRVWEDEQRAAPERLHHRFGQAVQGLKVIEESGTGPCRVEVAAGVAEVFDLAVVAEGGVFMRQADRPAVAAGSHEWRHDYGQTAWVGTVSLVGGTPGLAVERFSRQGPLALLPLPPAADAPAEAGPGEQPARVTRASLVWCVNAAEDPVMGLGDEQRMAVINAMLPEQAGRIVQIGPLKSFPLGLQAQTRLVQGGCLVRIGNAAQTLHPVAGQGLNLGLRDAHALVEALRLAQRRGHTLAQLLAQVQWSRAADRWSMIAATDFLARSFTWSLPGAASARALGLLAVEHLPGLKSALARQMMFGRR
ncbi:MAG: FAD-dependent monooxygenase [Burkholderiaceae bacterium]